MLASLRSTKHIVRGTCCSTKHPELSRFDLERDRITDCVDSSLFDGTEETFVVICAGIFQIDRCCRESARTRAINVDNTITLIRDLVERTVKPIFISTNYVFDGEAGHYDEDALPHPICEYGRQKLAVEEQVRTEFPEAVTLRLDRLVCDRPAPANLFSQWSECLRAGEPIRCIRGQTLAPTAIADVAFAVLAACRQRLSGVYHVANQEFFYRDELAHRFVEACGHRQHAIESLPLSAFGFDDPRPLRAHLNGTRFAEVTGLRFTPIDDVMQRLIDGEGTG